jgi:hypothetical protein
MNHEELQQLIAHLRTRYRLQLFTNKTRTTVISMHWWEDGDTRVSALTKAEWERFFPGSLFMEVKDDTSPAADATITTCSIKQYDNHVCPDLVNAVQNGTMFDLCAELLAEVFKACRSIYKKCGVAAREQHAMAGTMPSWILVKVNESATQQERARQLAVQWAKWDRLGPDQKAALLLFTNPPVRVHPSAAGNDGNNSTDNNRDVHSNAHNDACVRLYSPKEYK